MPKKRFVFKLRFWVICAGVLLAVFIPILRSQTALAKQQQEQLAVLQQERYAESMRGIRLQGQLQEAETDLFREREVRRRFGYVREGAIRFEAEPPGLQPTDAAAEGQLDPAGDAEQPLDKDWSNFK